MQDNSQSTMPGRFPAQSGLSDAPVAILLSLYNGGTYLSEQLASLEGQTHTNWVLYWRDDGSTDGTLSLMQHFSQKMGHRCIMVTPRNGQHLGVTASYSHLLAAVPPDMPVAFCDQDDVWLPDKLARGLKALATLPSTQPGLYCARQTLTDRNLTPVGLSPPLPQATSFLAALTQNIATGCTIMLSPAACALLKKAMPASSHILHDWWAYLLVAGAGGNILTDNRPVLLYRQHGQNAVGAPARFMQRALGALRRGPSLFMDIFRANTLYLLSRRQLLTPENQESLRLIQQGLGRGWRGLAARFSLLQKMEQLRRHEKLEQLVFRLWFLLG